MNRLRYERDKQRCYTLGKLLELPCVIGNTVYTNASIQGWYFRKEGEPYEAKVVFIGLNGAGNYMNVDFGNGYMLQFHFSEIGKNVFLTREKPKRHWKGWGNESRKREVKRK